MARGRRGRATKSKKPTRARKGTRRAKAAARKPAKRGAAKSKPSRARAKPTAKRVAARKPRAKKPAPARQQRLEMDVIDVETIEEVAPGVSVVTDYEVIGVRPAPAENKSDEAEGS
jgi:hypothetical protein